MPVSPEVPENPLALAAPSFPDIPENPLVLRLKSAMAQARFAATAAATVARGAAGGDPHALQQQILSSRTCSSSTQETSKSLRRRAALRPARRPQSRSYVADACLHGRDGAGKRVHSSRPKTQPGTRPPNPKFLFLGIDLAPFFSFDERRKLHRSCTHLPPSRPDAPANQASRRGSRAELAGLASVSACSIREQRPLCARSTLHSGRDGGGAGRVSETWCAAFFLRCGQASPEAEGAGLSFCLSCRNTTSAVICRNYGVVALDVSADRGESSAWATVCKNAERWLLGVCQMPKSRS